MYVPRYIKEEEEDDSVDIACINGDLNQVQDLYSQGRYSENAMKYAIESGNLDVVKFLINNNVESTVNPIDLAIVQYLHSLDVVGTTNAIDYASMNGSLDVVMFLHSVGYKYTSNAVDYAYDNNYTEIIKFFRTHK